MPAFFRFPANRVAVLSLFAVLLLWPSTSSAQQHWSLEDTLVITDVNVVDVRTGEIRRDQIVIIERDRINAVGGKGTRYPRNAPSVNAKGGYLIPGLWDMHVHLTFGDWFPLAQDISLPLFVANGITSVRDMGSNLETIQSWRNEIEGGRLIGPRILTSGPMLDGPKPRFPDSIAVTTPEDGARAVDDLKRRGVDFIKLQSLIPRDAVFAIAAEAKKQAKQAGIKWRELWAAKKTLPLVCEGREPSEFLESVDDDARDAAGDGRAKLGVRLAAAVQNEARGRKPGALGGEQLAHRAHVEQQRRRCQPARQCDEQQRLSGVCDLNAVRVGSGGNARYVGVEHVRVDREERRSVALGEFGGGDAAEHHRAHVTDRAGRGRARRYTAKPAREPCSVRSRRARVASARALRIRPASAGRGCESSLRGRRAGNGR